MLEFLISAALYSQTAPALPISPQTRPVLLEEVDVVGRPLDILIRDFVAEVGQPAGDRNLARWDQRVCVGVMNLETQTAEYIADRVSQVASDLGLQTGDPGCTPNILIIATDQPETLTRTMVDERRRLFFPNASGTTGTRAALERFVKSSAPVKWWTVSAPIDSATGVIATRMPGYCDGTCDSPSSYAPIIPVHSMSRVTTQIVDNLLTAIVVVDVNQTQNVSAQQLADYIAMVSLAQVRPEADTSRYASILNVFDDPEASASLTDWDTAYLGGLYEAQRTQKITWANRAKIAAAIGQVHARMRAEQD